MYKKNRLKYTRIVVALFSAVFSLAILLTCKNSSVNASLPAKGDIFPYSSYREIPGVSENEINAITALQNQKLTFTYGMIPGTEAFLGEDGEIYGFASLFCDWLSELFGIPFVINQFAWDELVDGLQNGSIDFTGELSVTRERSTSYFMTGTIAERLITYIKINDGVSLSGIAASQKPRFAFLEGTTTASEVARASYYKFDTVLVEDYRSAYRLLKDGGADAFFAESGSEYAFEIYDDVYCENFFPLILLPVSLSTQNRNLIPIISVVQKALENGGLDFFKKLYKDGEKEYRKHKLQTTLTAEELEFIHKHPLIPYAAEYYNYPVSFYNKYSKEWQGIFFDILNELEEISDLSFSRVNDEHTEWPDLYRMLESGKASMISELLRSDDREGRFFWPDRPILTDYYAFLTKADYPNIELKDIWNIRVGIIKDSAYAEMFHRWFPDHRHTTEYISADECFLALENNEVDTVLSSQRRLLALTYYHELHCYKNNIVLDYPNESTIGINHDSGLLCSIVEKSLRQMNLQAISGNWVNQTFDYKTRLLEAQRPWLIGLSILCFCVFVLLLMLFQRKRQEGKNLEKLVQKRTAERDKQNLLIHTVNDTAALLMKSIRGDDTEALGQSMDTMCSILDSDSISLWQNRRKEKGKQYFRLAFRWVHKDKAFRDIAREFAYQDIFPVWEAILARGDSINGTINKFPENERLFLTSLEMQSLLAVPIFIENEFWGFAGIEDHRKQRTFNESEEQALRSWGLLVVSAIRRGITFTKLEAVINNYKGIIWSVDSDRVFTTFSGQYLKQNRIDPSILEGKTMEAARRQNKFTDIIESVEKTFNKGPQDWITESDVGVFHSHTALILDSGGKRTGVVGSTDDITETYRLQRELEKAVDAAKAANSAKSAFLANMSHEIRTPMNSIIGFSELAMDDEIPRKTQEYINNIKENSIWLLQIINDILDISKIESGKMELEKIPFTLHDLFMHCQTIMTPKAIEKKLNLYFYAEPTIGKKLLGDPVRFRQVIINLLSNAIKFTNVGMVKLSAEIENSDDNHLTLRFEIKDSGIGMTAEQIKKIFEPFIQADVSTTRKYGGSGLGLTIAKNIIELMGGKLTVESTPGIGSKFYFSLTFETVAIPEESPDEKPDSAEMKKPVFSGEVLVCEDNPMNQMVICEHLERVGLKVLLAEDGKKAVNMVKIRAENGEKPFDLIFMDMHMPVMDGLEATPKIRELGTGTPIVAMTANIISHENDLYSSIGLSGYISKPFTSQELWNLLLKYFTPISFKPIHADLHKPDDEELQKRLKTSFASNNRTVWNQISNALDSGEIKLAHRIAHTLKNSAALIGKTSLQTAAANVETLLKDENDKVIDGEGTEGAMARLRTELEKVLKELAPFFETPNPGVKAKPMDREKSEALFRQLEPLLRDGNPESLNFMDDLRSVPGSKELIQQMVNFDFELAVRSLENIKKRAKEKV